jgi:hypothetical protein
VSHEAILVCPENFSNRPVAISIDVRKQLTVLRRQLARIARIDDLLDLLSPVLTFDLEPDGNGIPQRKTADVSSAIRLVEARYAPECLSTCEMCYFCRDEARGCTAALGRDAREELGGVEHVGTALRLARADEVPAPGSDLAEAAAVLRTAARLRADILQAAI